MDKPLEDPLDRALPDDDEGDDYDRDEDFDGDYQGADAFVLKGSEELEMDFEVFGRYAASGEENGKPKYTGPKDDEGLRPEIVYRKGRDGKSYWCVCVASGDEVFSVESDAGIPPKTGWRKEYGEEDLDVSLEPLDGAKDEGGELGDAKAKGEGEPTKDTGEKRKCPW